MSEDVFHFMQQQAQINKRQNESWKAQKQQLAEILRLLSRGNNNNGRHGNASVSHLNTITYTPTDDTAIVTASVAAVSLIQIPKQRMSKLHSYTDEDKSLYP